MHVRELPPLRQHIEIVTPSGRTYKWGEDEPAVANVPSGVRHSSTMPGGFESMDATLPRKPGTDYSDLERLSTIRIVGAGGEIDGEYRLERTPRVSGDQMAISPSAVGWQAHLEDDKSASLIIIDRDLGRWQPSPPRARVVSAEAVAQGFGVQSAEVLSGAAEPTLRIGVRGPWTAAAKPLSEPWYDAGPGNRIGRVAGLWARNANLDNTDANWNWAMVLSDDEGATVGVQNTGTLRAAGPSPHTINATTPRRYALLQTLYSTGPAGVDNMLYAIDWTQLYVLGDHGMLPQGIPPGEGFKASDVLAHVVPRWAPLLKATLGETILPSTFIIPQLAFIEPTTVGEMVRQTTRFGLQDWAVWEDRTFWWHDRGARGRKWRARIAPAQLEETGPQVDRLWESVIVQYQDVGGATRTVGPPGSGADTESSLLKDVDPDNPANRLGITRRDLLVMGVGTVESAIEVGRRFLELQKLLDSSGRAVLVGHVQDDRGVMHPYSRVRAGDEISFIDAADPSYRRIVKVDHTRATRSCSVDLDAPPDGLAALLERLGVVLVPLGL